MIVSEKPFVCNEKNCNMTFANEDHLNVHKKKHTMSFNLELAIKNNETAAIMGDQTPTPTSFFRNCEEVGLFQDLQNVNPFEETFKKALENTSLNDVPKLGTLSLVSNEDTLHTPHIFPIVEDPSNISNKCIVNNELSIENIVLSQKKYRIDSIDSTNSNIKLKEKQENFRHKLREVLLRKDKFKYIQNIEASSEFDLSASSLLILERPETVICVNRGDSRKDQCNNNSEKIDRKVNLSHRLEKVREMNRAAQIRCRNKKKKYYDRMSIELSNLKKENFKLKQENDQLRRNNNYLYRVLEELGGTKEETILSIVDVGVLNGNKDNVQISNQEENPKKLPVLAPANKLPILKSMLPSPKPIIYNLLPVQVVTSPSSINRFTSSISTSEIKKRKNLPRILKRT